MKPVRRNASAPPSGCCPDGRPWSAVTPRSCGSANAEEAPGDVDPDAVTDRLESVDVRAFSAPPAHTEARLRRPRRPGRPDQERPQDRAAPSGVRPAGGAAAFRRRDRARAPTALAGPGAPSAYHHDPVHGVHARRGRRGGGRTPLPVGAGRSGRAAELVHRASAGPGAPSFRLHHGPAPGRGGRAAAAREPAPQAPARVLGSRRARRGARSGPAPSATVSPQEAGRRALVEQTDHAEWVDQQRERGPAQGDSWEPVPVPLPTYVTAPVAPRATGGVEVGDPETWSAARSSPAEPTRTGTRSPPRPTPNRPPAAAATRPSAPATAAVRPSSTSTTTRTGRARPTSEPGWEPDSVTCRDTDFRAPR